MSVVPSVKVSCRPRHTKYPIKVKRFSSGGTLDESTCHHVIFNDKSSNNKSLQDVIGLTKFNMELRGRRKIDLITLNVKLALN